MREVERATTASRAPGDIGTPAPAPPTVLTAAPAPAPPAVLTAAEAAFLERCREDLAGLFEPTDAVEEIVLRVADAGAVDLQARVVVSGTSATFAARGETLVEAYGRLRAAAPEQRLAIAYRAVVEEGLRR